MGGRRAGNTVDYSDPNAALLRAARRSAATLRWPQGPAGHGRNKDGTELKLYEVLCVHTHAMHTFPHSTTVHNTTSLQPHQSRSATASMGGSSSKPEDIVAIAKTDLAYSPPFGAPVKVRLQTLCSSPLAAVQRRGGDGAESCAGGGRLRLRQHTRRSRGAPLRAAVRARATQLNACRATPSCTWT